MARRVDRAALAFVLACLALAGATTAVYAAYRPAPPTIDVRRVDTTAEQPGQWSGLARDLDGTFWTVSDAGAAARENGGFGSPAWPLRLAHLGVQGKGVRILATVPLVQDGRPLSGADADTEDLALAPDGTFWLCDESPTPSLLHAARDGSVLARVPLPPRYATALPNHGPEGVAVGLDGRTVFLSTQTSGPDQANITAVALLAFDVANGTFAEHTYPLGDAKRHLDDPLTQPVGLTVSGMAAVGNRTVLVLERSSGEGDPPPPAWRRVFRVEVPAQPTPEPLAKKNVLNLKANGYTSIRPEGIAPLSDHSFAVIEDNNARGATTIWWIDVHRPFG